MRVLGIDLGSKRIGIAISDRTGTIASPLTMIVRSGSVRRDHAAIAELVEEEEVEIDESLDDAAFIEEQEEGDPDVSDIIGETVEKEEET